MAADPDLIVYIRQQTQDGVTANELRETLMEAGWNEIDVDNALHDVAAGLRPVTEGASIHEDLAQVRGMVAHLASRVKTLETRLAQAPAMPMAPGLPAGTGSPARELPRGHRRFATAMSVIVFALVILGGLLTYRAWQASALEPQTAGALALLLLIFFVVVVRLLRRRK
ncbi:MAG TPA: hypothetical protein VMU12_02925 [Candidatus Paceibacterota bacterium]|nr:hypothetical protein [Candidatus Paceibacterota bacterium]